MDKEMGRDKRGRKRKGMKKTDRGKRLRGRGKTKNIKCRIYQTCLAMPTVYITTQQNPLGNNNRLDRQVNYMQTYR
jgi:hypothetical protein